MPGTAPIRAPSCPPTCSRSSRGSPGWSRASPAVDQRSGVSARFAIAAAESAAASAVRRAALTGEDQPVARVCDLPAVVGTLRGKVEFEVGEEGREQEVLDHLLRRAIAETFRIMLGSADLSALLAKFEDGGVVESGDLVPGPDLLRRIGEVAGLAKIMERLGAARRGVARPGRRRARVRPGGPVPDAPPVQGFRRWLFDVPDVARPDSPSLPAARRGPARAGR